MTAARALTHTGSGVLGHARDRSPGTEYRERTIAPSGSVPRVARRGPGSLNLARVNALRLCQKDPPDEWIATGPSVRNCKQRCADAPLFAELPAAPVGYPARAKSFPSGSQTMAVCLARGSPGTALRGPNPRSPRCSPAPSWRRSPALLGRVVVVGTVRVPAVNGARACCQRPAFAPQGPGAATRGRPEAVRLSQRACLPPTLPSQWEASTRSPVLGRPCAPGTAVPPRPHLLRRFRATLNPCSTGGFGTWPT
jgi:hypothetical protein